jgi:hypothetical protein
MSSKRTPLSYAVFQVLRTGRRRPSSNRPYKLVPLQYPPQSLRPFTITANAPESVTVMGCGVSGRNSEQGESRRT